MFTRVNVLKTKRLSGNGRFAVAAGATLGCRDHTTSNVKARIDAAKLGKTGACHLLRYTMATLMHENGADIRFIQEILVHVKLETTQIYTRVSIRTLQQVHAATHPAALLGHRPDESQAASCPVSDPAARELFAALDAEAEEDQE
jgi:integrase/recombinase XerD